MPICLIAQKYNLKYRLSKSPVIYRVLRHILIICSLVANVLLLVCLFHVFIKVFGTFSESTEPVMTLKLYFWCFFAIILIIEIVSLHKGYYGATHQKLFDLKIFVVLSFICIALMLLWGAFYFYDDTLADIEFGRQMVNDSMQQKCDVSDIPQDIAFIQNYFKCCSFDLRKELLSENTEAHSSCKPQDIEMLPNSCCANTTEETCSFHNPTKYKKTCKEALNKHSGSLNVVAILSIINIFFNSIFVVSAVALVREIVRLHESESQS